MMIFLSLSRSRIVARSVCRVAPDALRVDLLLSAVPDRDPYADVSDKTLKAYKAYTAAIEDPTCSRADLARLTGKLEEERQSDRERARYHRMQDEEAAILAAAAGGDYDSDTETLAPRHAVCALCCVLPAPNTSFTLRREA